jgi:hypothetical protein
MTWIFMDAVRRYQQKICNEDQTYYHIHHHAIYTCTESLLTFVIGSKPAVMFCVYKSLKSSCRFGARTRQCAEATCLHTKV